MRKIKMMVSLILIMMLVLSSNVLAMISDNAEPSEWAQEEIFMASEENIIPRELQSNYQNNIKRYEYVLLALSILEKNGNDVDVIYQSPFTDITNHPYRYEIVKAYNAGLINGYEDGTFRADNEITRQEVATLVVNLVKKIDPFRDTRNNGKHTYSDKDSIGAWARQYIDYCYNNDILKGIGKDANALDIINPKGQTTIEQSIILLYRLAKEENLFDQYDLGTVTVTTIGDNTISIDKDIDTINDFASTVDLDMAKTIVMLSEDESYVLSYLSKNSTVIQVVEQLKYNADNEIESYNKIGEIEINKYDGIIDIRSQTMKDDEERVLKAMAELLDALGVDESIYSSYGKKMLVMEINSQDFYSKIYDNNDLLTISREVRSDEIDYSFNYQYKLAR